MPFPDDASLGDILGDQPGFREIANRFTTKGVTSTPFAGGTQHSGTLKSLQTVPIDLGWGELALPGITAGIPFRLAIFDSPVGKWHLDLVVDSLNLKLHGLHGADFVKEAGTTPRRLIRKQTDTAVVISGEATLRFARASESDPVVVLFIENRSAADPMATTGAVVFLRCNPPHFFFGSSQFGMTLTELLFDASSTFSPQFVRNQGQGADWVGFAVAEATFYAPPNAIGRGGFSGGVRNLLLGSPRGVQGELELQWGRAPLDPTTFVFTQDGHTTAEVTGSGNLLQVMITAGQDDQVQMAVGLAASAPPEGGTVTDWQATWRWPDGSETTGDTSTGQVGHGQVLRVTPEEHVAGRPVIRHPEISFRFVASGEVPRIDVISTGTTITNVIHVAGPKAGIEALQFDAHSTAPSRRTFAWKLGDGAEQTGTRITLPAAEITGDKLLILKEIGDSEQKRQTQLRVQVIEGVDLLIGGENGVVTAAAPTVPLTPAAVEGTYDLTDFHARGWFRPVMIEVARLNPNAAAQVHVPDGALAIVTIASSGKTISDNHSSKDDRHVQIVFEFNKGTAIGWGEYKPVAALPPNREAGLHSQLLQWTANYPDANFLIIGRCDDLGTDERNATLAHDRRDTAKHFLTTVPAGSKLIAIPTNRITDWGEQDGKPKNLDEKTLKNLLSDEELAAQRLINAIDDNTGAPLTDKTGWPPKHAPTEDPIAESKRELFRRADIYAVGGTPTGVTIRQELSPGRAPDLRRMMIPGKTANPTPAVTSTPEMDYRVKLLVGWDKPTGEGWSDLIPSKAEFEFAWTPQKHPLPPLNGQSVDLGAEVLTIYGSWSHNDATGFTRSQVGIRSDGDPDGLFPPLQQKNLVATLALGPVLLSGLNSQTHMIEKAGRISALALGAGFAQWLLKDGSQATVKKVEATAEIGNLTQPGDAYKVMLTHDYSTVLHVHVDTRVLVLSTEPDYPVKFRYKNVTIHFDSTQSNFWDKVGLAYPTDSISIEDPGKWKIDGVLGKLMRAVKTALGTGSLWIETRFAFALTIGVVEISEADIRVTFTPKANDDYDIDFSLRGLVAKIDIPKTVKGEGRLRIEGSGVIKAGVDLELIPLNLKASAAFAMANMTTPKPYTYVYLFVKVQFPVGIPLGPSGAAIHGFLGQTAINGTRNLGLKPPDDIVTREIGWWKENPENKYTPQKDQHALGVGVVVGTLPDASFCLSATGMLVVAFPDPEVILGVEVNILSVPDKTAKDQKEGQSASITGLIVIDDTAVSMAVSARYTIPKVLEVKAPIAAYFPYSPHGVYVRIGSDGQMGRSGEPVTLTLLPSTINLQAFSYLMIEQDGLHNLGGNPAFSFDGFSVGFGAGAGIEWKAEPIRLSASILLLAGFGTDPLFIKAGIFVKGELDLVVVSVSARGEIVLTYLNDNISLDGEFCGKVDLFLFSVEGCAKFHIGTPPVLVPPPPEPPVASVVLTDRGNRIMGEALAGGGVPQANPIFQMTEVGDEMQNTGKDPKDNNTVWADTAPVINFRHYIEDADAAGGQFQRAGQPSGERWFGSNRLKYTYRLDKVRLIRVSESDEVLVTGANPLKSAWETSPARQPGSAGPQQPSGAEVQSLRLLDWQPWGWALPMADGGASAPGDPVELIRKLCDPIPEPAHACLYGQDARGAGVDRIRLLHETPPPGPYPSRFTLTGRPVLKLGDTDILIEGEVLNAQIAQLGGMVIPGAINDLTKEVAGLTGLLRGYQLPEAQIATIGRINRIALPWLADLDRTIRRGHLLLMVCNNRIQRTLDEPRLCYDFTGLSIGREFVVLDVSDFIFEALDSASPFAITDHIDRSQGNPIFGADNLPDIRITPPGIRIRLRESTRIIELHFYYEEIAPIKVMWTDSAGKSYSLVESRDKKGVVLLRLEAGADIIEITVSSNANALYLYQICKIGGYQVQSCFNFDGLTPNDVQSGFFFHAGVAFKSLDPNIGFSLFDSIDTTEIPVRQGKDGHWELSFPHKGVELIPNQLWSSISIGVFSYGAQITAQAFDTNGNLIAHAQSDRERNPFYLYLEAIGIARIVVTGGDNEAVIFRICHDDNLADGVCIDFRGTDTQTAEKLVLSNMILTPAEPGQLLELVDVLTEGNPITAQADGRPELMIPSGGLILTPAAPLARVMLYIVTLAGEMIEAVALDANGNKVSSAPGGGAVDTLNRLTLEGAGITQIMLRVSRECFLTRICTLAEDYLPDLPRIFTRENRMQIFWTPQIVSTIPADNGGICRIVRYDQPATLIDASSFEIETPVGNRTTLLTLCGVDSRADLAQIQDRNAQQDLKEVVTNAAAEESGANTREILLDPGQNYRIEIDWSWQAWTSNEKGTNSPPDSPLENVPGSDPSVSAWIKGERQNFVFKVASEDLSPGETQDGLNEYKFDPRDIARYLSRTEPADGRDVVFTDDPLWVHFNSGHVEALVDRYGRELQLWIRRTDPPPQPDADAMNNAVTPILLETIRLKGPHYTQTLAEQRINAAIIGAICLPDGPAMSGISIGARFQLEPNAMYDFNLIASKKDKESPDPVIVNATRFKTSRYANPSEMMAALGFSSTEVAPIAPQEIILSEGMALPSGPLSVSDLDMGVALAAIGADTLPLPGDEPRVIVLWLHRDDGHYGVAGILIDSPEPMQRKRAIIQGQQAVDSIRCEPELITLMDASFRPVRATLNWTRVLFVLSDVTSRPVKLNDEAVMSLRFKVAPGDTLTGQRIIYERPLMLDTEGF